MPSISAYDALEILKAEAKKLPSKPPQASLQQEKDKLKELCIKIFATRRNANAERNNKEDLQNTTVFTEDVDKMAAKMKDAEVFKGFLDHTSYAKLADLAATGHGGKLEEKFKEYLVSCSSIRPGTPQAYMPNAKDRIEALQKRIGEDSSAKKLSGPSLSAAFAELLATRAAVNAARHIKGSLEAPINSEKLTKEREKLLKDPMTQVIARIAGMGKNAIETARHGHGGKLEDMVRDEVRAFSTMQATNYTLPDVDAKYAPTHGERLRDIKNIMMYKDVPQNVKERLALELKNLDPNKADERIDNAKTVAEEAEKDLELFNKYAGRHERNLLLRAFPSGKEAIDQVLSSFHINHAGQMMAEEMMENFRKEEQEIDSPEEIKSLIAKHMVLAKALSHFDADKPYRLSSALDEESFQDAVQDMMEDISQHSDDKAALQEMLNEVKLETANAFQNAITVGKADPAPASQLDNPVVNQR